jgi:predicted secreted Zn-dependent protease
MRATALALALLLLAACARDVGGDDATRGSRTEPPATDDAQESPARAEPRVVVRTRLRPYDVSGSSGVELRAAMERLGPKDSVSGTPYAGYTRWRIAWSYRVERARACELASVRVVARIRITVPRWTRAGQADPSLAAEWRRFVTALRRHENGHAAIATAAARRIGRRLASLRAFRSCARLERAADRAAVQILNNARAAEVAYDERTRHGDTQGARFSA